MPRSFSQATGHNGLVDDRQHEHVVGRADGRLADRVRQQVQQRAGRVGCHLDLEAHAWPPTTTVRVGPAPPVHPRQVVSSAATFRCVRRVPPDPTGATVVVAKLRPPELPLGSVARSRLVDRLEAAARGPRDRPRPATARPSPLGSGWQRRPTPCVFSLDLLDEDPVTFWQHFIGTVRAVLPGVDDEAEQALLENPRSATCLQVLIGQIERSTGRAALVLDDLTPAVRSILDWLALLVDRVGDRLRLVITARADPGLPLAVASRVGHRRPRGPPPARGRRGAGGRRHLRRPPCCRDRRHPQPLVQRMADRPAPRAGVDERDRRSRGEDALAFLRPTTRWPTSSPAEILDQLPPEFTAVALDLSIIEWFDADMSRELAGSDAGTVVADLEGAGCSSARSTAARGHAVPSPVRELLAGSCGGAIPSVRTELHRMAAAIHLRRGTSCCWPTAILTAVGDVGAAHELVLQPAYRLIDRGDRAGLLRLLGSLGTGAVGDPALAIDLAVAWFFAGSGEQAAGWCERALRAMARKSATVVRRTAVEATLSLMNGDLDAAAVQCGLRRSLGEQGGVRAHRAAGSRPPPRGWPWPPWPRRGPAVDRPGSGRCPAGAVEHVTVPGLEAWLELACGRLGVATELSERACRWAEGAGIGRTTGPSTPR